MTKLFQKKIEQNSHKNFSKKILQDFPLEKNLENFFWKILSFYVREFFSKFFMTKIKLSKNLFFLIFDLPKIWAKLSSPLKITEYFFLFSKKK